MSLQDIIDVAITRETKTVSRAGFSTVNIMGDNKAFSPLIQYYTDLTSVLLDFRSIDPEAVAAASAFAQNPRPTRIAISRRDTGDNSVVTVGEVVDDTEYAVTINGTEFAIDSGSSATNLTIAAALVAAINGGSEPVTATDNSDGTFDLDPDVADVFYSVLLSLRLSIAYTTPTAVATDIANISNADDDWYGLMYTGRTQADVEAIAVYIETVSKIFLTSSADADIVDTTDAADSTTVAATLKAAAYARSGVIYHPTAATIYPEAALFGRILPLDPGSYTAAFKTLTGIAVTTLTETQKTNALAKNCNIYVLTGGVNITREGTVAEGEYIDIMVFIDWLIARIVEGEYANVVNLPKVPFTDGGIAGVEAILVAVLQLGIARGGIAADDGAGNPGYTVTVPKAADVSSGDKAARTLNGVTFTAILAGAIHAMQIRGTVTV
jgi:hypothetical protein